MVLLCLWGILSAAGCRTASSASQDSLEQERRYKQLLAAAQVEDNQRLSLQRKAEQERQRQQALQKKRYQESVAAAQKEDERRLAAEKKRAQQLEAQRKAEVQERAAEEKRRKEQAVAAKKAAKAHQAGEILETNRQVKLQELERRRQQELAAKRLAAQRTAEDQRLAQEKRQAQEQLAAQKKVQEERLAAQRKAETERRVAEEKQRADEARRAETAAKAERRQAQAAHQADPAKKEAGGEARTPTKRMISASEVTQQVYLLQFGDELEVSVWGHTDLNVKSPIREDGTFSFPLIGQVEAIGHSLKEVEESVRERLNRDYIVNPQVTARLTGARFSVFGEVQQPGSYPIEGSMDLLTAISIAGGITKFGSSRVEVIRGHGNEKVTIRTNLDRIVHGKEPNVNILPHDTVYVKRRMF